jgi:hypothetical protein
VLPRSRSDLEFQFLWPNFKPPRAGSSDDQFATSIAQMRGRSPAVGDGLPGHRLPVQAFDQYLTTGQTGRRSRRGSSPRDSRFRRAWVSRPPSSPSPPRPPADSSAPAGVNPPNSCTHAAAMGLHLSPPPFSSLTTQYLTSISPLSPLSHPASFEANTDRSLIDGEGSLIDGEGAAPPRPQGVTI